MGVLATLDTCSIAVLSGRILEMGCGTGYLQHALAQQQPGQAIGLDASRWMLRRTQRRAQRDALKVHLVEARSQALPCASGQFDRVVATFPSEYILDPATLTEIQRVLHPSGALVIVDSAHFTRDGLYQRLVDLLYRVTFQASVVRDIPPQSPYVPLLQHAGFQVTVFPETVDASEVLVVVAHLDDHKRGLS
ncbi:MAG: class I SAM-dependent methyltransferase [Chloroflexaceae bacterium]|nr:class I SAM-dependent methyltransferase [Chloroflexaceae bacterium]